MTKKRLTPRLIADMFFYYQDNMRAEDIAELTGSRAGTIGPTVNRVKKFLKSDDNSSLSLPYQEALKIIRREKEVRNKIDRIAQIKNNLFRDLEEVIDGLVENIVKEKHAKIVAENIKLQEIITHLQTQLSNKEIIATSYQTEFLKK